MFDDFSFFSEKNTVFVLWLFNFFSRKIPCFCAYYKNGIIHAFDEFYFNHIISATVLFATNRVLVSSSLLYDNRMRKFESMEASVPLLPTNQMSVANLCIQSIIKSFSTYENSHFFCCCLLDLQKLPFRFHTIFFYV